VGIKPSARVLAEFGDYVRSADLFPGGQDGPDPWAPEGHRSLTMRVVLRPTEATLTTEESGVIRNRALAALSQELGAHLR
jgi:phenylalanyl-tRNA synthetase beta subunit